MRDSILSWQQILAQAFTSAEQLLEFLQLPSLIASSLAQRQFKTRVPRGFAQRMQRGNPRDPLLLQVLAVEDELQVTPDFVLDPLDELTTNSIPGLIHKYHGRVLLTVTGTCAINCRYCFRRHFPYQNNNPGRSGWQPVMDYISKDENIHEVILSGGDPLLATDMVLEALITQLVAISHVTTLRIHTRIPIVLPERITDDFIKLLNATRLHVVIVLHTNHAQELDASVEKACIQLRKAGCHLLNQSVLLAGVNDSAETLAMLSQRLFSYGVLPYYLHLLDKVQGAAHFDVKREEALRIFQQLQALLPGYLVPKLAREEAGEKHKTLIF
jgi:EF-P beta-lysylation protein EpmB